MGDHARMFALRPNLAVRSHHPGRRPVGRPPGIVRLRRPAPGYAVPTARVNMEAMSLSPEFRHNPDQSRYEILIGGRVVGLADYDIQGDVVVFPHTEVEPSLRRRGLAAELVRNALDDVRATGRTVVPSCWYV